MPKLALLMKSLFIDILSALLLLIFLFSCNKSQDTIATTVGDLKINLITPNASPGINNYETIISEPAGKILLDTISPPNTDIVATLKTNATLVDITNVYFDSYGITYNVVTYKAVDPSTWTSIYSGSYHAPVGGSPSNVPAEMFFTNIPSGNSILFSNCTAEPPNSFTIDVLAKTLDVSYHLHASNYAYAIWPNEKRYTMQIPKDPHDTIDCSNPDTTKELALTHSPLYDFYHSRLIGILDTTDFTRSLFLYDNYLNPLFTLPELLYPEKNIQKYELMTEWLSGNNENIAAYSYGDKPDGRIDYPDNSMYSITSILNNHFSVDFKSVRPSYYTTNWQAGNIVWTIYASPDSAVLDPLGILSVQKSSILQGQSLGALKLLSFQFENVQGFDYQGYLSYTCNPALLKTKRVTNAVSYSKKF
jgi:hypothetical protein